VFSGRPEPIEIEFDAAMADYVACAARVVSPASLTQEILEEVQAARERYTPKLTFEPLKMALDDRQRNWLVG
jgi:hypothetical protein